MADDSTEDEVEEVKTTVNEKLVKSVIDTLDEIERLSNIASDAQETLAFIDEVSKTSDIMSDTADVLETIDNIAESSEDI